MDEHCRYCSEEPNGDPADDHIDLIRKKVATIGSDVLYAGVQILSGKLWWYLGGEETDYPTPAIKINYCPVCGRALGKKKSRPTG